MRNQANLPMGLSGARCLKQARTRAERWIPVREFLLPIEVAMAATLPGRIEVMALRENPA